MTRCLCGYKTETWLIWMFWGFSWLEVFRVCEFCWFDFDCCLFAFEIWYFRHFRGFVVFCVFDGFGYVVLFGLCKAAILGLTFGVEFPWLAAGFGFC